MDEESLDVELCISGAVASQEGQGCGVDVSRTAPPRVAFGVGWRCKRRRGSYPNARYQTLLEVVGGGWGGVGGVETKEQAKRKFQGLCEG